MKLAKRVTHKDEVGASTFNASVWYRCNRFMDRNHPSLRQRTKIAHKLPRQLDEKNCHHPKMESATRAGPEWQYGRNANDFWRPRQLYSLHIVGKKAVLIKSTGHEKTHFTVVLSCMADGTKLQTLVKFKSKTMPKSAKLPSVAKEALVIMIVGINEHWKVPIAYFLIDALNGREREWIWWRYGEVIQYLNPHGIVKKSIWRAKS